LRWADSLYRSLYADIVPRATTGFETGSYVKALHCQPVASHI